MQRVIILSAALFFVTACSADSTEELQDALSVHDAEDSTDETNSPADADSADTDDSTNDGADVTDVSDIEDTADTDDADDATDSTDAADTSDAIEITDVADTSDTEDTTDTLDSTDTNDEDTNIPPDSDIVRARGEKIGYITEARPPVAIPGYYYVYDPEKNIRFRVNSTNGIVAGSPLPERYPNTICEGPTFYSDSRSSVKIDLGDSCEDLPPLEAPWVSNNGDRGLCRNQLVGVSAFQTSFLREDRFGNTECYSPDSSNETTCVVECVAYDGIPTEFDTPITVTDD